MLNINSTRIVSRSNRQTLGPSDQRAFICSGDRYVRYVCMNGCLYGIYELFGWMDGQNDGLMRTEMIVQQIGRHLLINRTRDDRQVVVMFAGFKISLDFVYMFAALIGRLSVACLIGTCRYADDGTGLNGN